MNKYLIGQLEPGKMIDSFFALRSIKLLSLRDGSGSYLAVVLGDKTGIVEGRAWNSAQEIYNTCRSAAILHHLVWWTCW